MKIVLIGSGNVAWNLGLLFEKNGHEVVQIISRNLHTSSELAYELDTESANYFSILHKNADIYIVAVQDEAIPFIVNELKGLNKLIVHTSGAVSMDMLKDCSREYGILYPLQSLVYGNKTLPEIPFLVQGNTENVKNKLLGFVQTLNAKVIPITDSDKAKLHLGAVFVNNFTNHLYSITYAWLAKNHLDFSLLLPLMKETIQRLGEKPPEAFQTGPAIRNDLETIKKHETLLVDEPYLLSVYQLMTKGIQKIV